MPYYYLFYKFCQRTFSLPAVLGFCCRFLPITWLLAWALVIVGLFWGLLLSPSDQKMGDAYRIIYVHVPSAALSMAVYVFMASMAILYLIYQQKILALCMRLAAPIGAVFTALALITGSIWGHKMWGTWWEWSDARLVSELILLLIYLGFWALIEALPPRMSSNNIGAVVLVVGLINIPIIHFSVSWWNSLHQGATLFKIGAPNIAMSMLIPLLLMLFGFFVFFAAYMQTRIASALLQMQANRQF